MLVASDVTRDDITVFWSVLPLGAMFGSKALQQQVSFNTKGQTDLVPGLGLLTGTC